MDKMPDEIATAFNKIMDYMTNGTGVLVQDVRKEIVSYESEYGESFVANCAMDSARAVIKDFCKQVICNYGL